MSIDYTTVSEITDYNVTQEQILRMYTRYRFAAAYCNGKEVLEVACGTGQGLGLLAKYAKKVVGGDYDDNIVKSATEYYKNRIQVHKVDAHNLPYEDKSFDVIICYEAIYYLSDPNKFIAESKRVLRDNGTIIICSANKEWSGFNPSPFSYTYFSASELFNMLNDMGFRTEIYADCPVERESFAGKVIGIIKVLAVKLHLMPKTMKAKELLKRIFFGKLTPLPAELKDGMAEYTPPVPIAHDKPVADYKVIFAVGRK